MAQNYTTVVGESAVEAELRAEIERLIQTIENCRHDFRITLKRAEKAESEVERLTHLLDLSKKTTKGE